MRQNMQGWENTVHFETHVLPCIVTSHLSLKLWFAPLVSLQQIKPKTNDSSNFDDSSIYIRSKNLINIRKFEYVSKCCFILQLRKMRHSFEPNTFWVQKFHKRYFIQLVTPWLKIHDTKKVCSNSPIYFHVHALISFAIIRTCTCIDS